MGFAEERVDANIKKLVALCGKKEQTRLDSFFTFKPPSATDLKRKADAAQAKLKAAKAAKTSAKGKPGGRR
jgi:hypothetical protein